MLHGELGRYPLSVTEKCLMITFWGRLINGKPTKYTYKVYEHMCRKTKLILELYQIYLGKSADPTISYIST